MEWQKVQTLIRLLQKEQSDQGLHCLPKNLCRNIWCHYGNLQVVSFKFVLGSWVYKHIVRSLQKRYAIDKCSNNGRRNGNLKISRDRTVLHHSLPRS